MKLKLTKAKETLYEQKVSCVVQNRQGEVWCSDAFGIKPLMMRLREDRKAFDGCVIADKVVGKAAALLAVLGGAEAVYGAVMSEGAEDVFIRNDMYYEYGTLVPYIENRTHTGACPMEETVRTIFSPEEAFEALERTIQKIMSGK